MNMAQPLSITTIQLCCRSIEAHQVWRAIRWTRVLRSVMLLNAAMLRQVRDVKEGWPAWGVLGLCLLHCSNSNGWRSFLSLALRVSVPSSRLCSTHSFLDGLSPLGWWHYSLFTRWGTLSS